MNPRIIIVIGLLAFIGLLLVMGARALARWLKIHYPRQASAILLGLWIGGLAVGWLMVRELRTELLYQPNDLLTLQETVVTRTIPAVRDIRSWLRARIWDQWLSRSSSGAPSTHQPELKEQLFS